MHRAEGALAKHRDGREVRCGPPERRLTTARRAPGHAQEGAHEPVLRGQVPHTAGAYGWPIAQGALAS